MPFYGDLSYLIFLAPALIFMMYAQWRVKSAYKKWGKIPNSRNISGVQATQQLLSEQGLYGLTVRAVPGELTDHYDPRNRSLNFSDGIGRGTSVASLAVTAHEIGHAMQHDKGNLLFGMRGAIFPVTSIGSRVGPILFFAGFFFSFSPLMWLGIIFFSFALIFTLITLPLEIDASRKGMKMLTTSGFLVGNDELRGARAVLQAAALTYVASVLMAMVQLLRYVLLARRRR